MFLHRNRALFTGPTLLENPKVVQPKTVKPKRYLYYIMPIAAVILIFWEESGMQRWLHDELTYEMHWMKTEGVGWQIWNGEDTLGESAGASSGGCQDWIKYKVGRMSMDMCLGKDTMSQEIRKLGYSEDCRNLAQQWSKNDPNPNVMDIGAGVGACIAEFLLTTDAKLIAFESNDLNLFHLTSTLLRHSEYKDRVTLFPVALRDATGESIDRFDGLILSGSAQLVNIRAGHHECQVLDGMTSFLPRIKNLRLFVNHDDLESKSCSMEILMDKLKNQFRVSWHRGRLRPLPKVRQNYYAVARNKKIPY